MCSDLFQGADVGFERKGSNNTSKLARAASSIWYTSGDFTCHLSHSSHARARASRSATRPVVSAPSSRLRRARVRPNRNRRGFGFRRVSWRAKSGFSARNCEWIPVSRGRKLGRQLSPLAPKGLRLAFSPCCLMLLRTSILVVTLLSVAALPSAPPPGLRPLGAASSGIAREEPVVFDRRRTSQRLLAMAAPAKTMRVRGGSAVVKEADDEEKTKETESSFLTLANVSYLLVGMTAMVFYQVHSSHHAPSSLTSLPPTHKPHHTTHHPNPSFLSLALSLSLISILGRYPPWRSPRGKS